MRDDLELVPKHLAGSFEVNVRASPAPFSASYKSSNGEQDDRDTGNSYTLTAITQRTEAECLG